MFLQIVSDSNNVTFSVKYNLYLKHLKQKMINFQEKNTIVYEKGNEKEQYSLM